MSSVRVIRNQNSIFDLHDAQRRWDANTKIGSLEHLKALDVTVRPQPEESRLVEASGGESVWSIERTRRRNRFTLVGD